MQNENIRLAVPQAAIEAALEIADKLQLTKQETKFLKSELIRHQKDKDKYIGGDGNEYVDNYDLF